MPGWYKHLRPYLDSGDLNAIGIIQEQHGDRTRLFNQWQEMDDMTLVTDSLNRLDVSAVPIVLFVDEHGVIRKRNPKPDDLSDFLDQNFDLPQDAISVEIPSRPGDRSAVEGKFELAIKQYKQYLATHPNDARTKFRMGVCYRKLFDRNSETSTLSDFSQAVNYWQAALTLDPNQYIWRRRLQQYGPVLSKPYPFYDWVAKARNEIESRGGTPAALSAEPAGAELVGPKYKASADSAEAVPPDPSGNVNRDVAGAVSIQQIVVRSTEGKKTARVHLLMRPSGLTDDLWNNEAGPVQIWCDASETFSPSQQLIEIEPPRSSATSNELRSTEFEVTWKVDPIDDDRLEGYVVYHLCNKRTGECVYKRQDISIPILSAER